MVKDAFRFALILTAMWCVCYFLDHGYDGLRSGVASTLADGAMRGPLGFIWGTFVWMVYLILIIGILVAAYMVLGFFGVGIWVVEKLAGMFAKIKNAWYSASDITDPKELPTAMRQVLSEFQKRIKNLEQKTAGLQPPPPPKSAEEQLRERDEQIRQLAEQLAKLQEAADA